MQYVEPLLGIALIFTSFLVHAKTQDVSQGNPEAVESSSQKHAAQRHDYVTSSRHSKAAKVPAASPQLPAASPKPVAEGKDEAYQTPVGAYNNNGYFGE